MTTPDETPNSIVLAGFLDFSGFNSLVQTENSTTFDEVTKSLYPTWKAANDFATNTLPKVDPYRPSPEMISRVEEDRLLKERREVIKTYPPYGVVPFDIAYVDMGNALPTQYRIDLKRVEAIKRRLSSKMDFKDLIEVCLSTEDHQIPIERNFIGQSADNEATLFLDDEDIRFRGVDLREANLFEAGGVPTNRARAKALTFLLAFGEPFITAFRFHRSIMDPFLHKVIQVPYVVLTNGYHRAYALWDLGYKKIPCVLADITPQEINAFAPNPDSIISACSLPRPPLFRDFFDSRAALRLNLLPRRRMFTMKWSIKTLPIFGNGPDPRSPTEAR